MEFDSACSISVAIPTYRRSEPIVNTISQVLALEHRPDQILVIDQTETHSTEAASTLSAMQKSGDILWRRLPAPSITRAMNVALLESHCDIVLFLDDDVEITSEVVIEHLEGHKISNAMVVVGKIRQPWQQKMETARRQYNFTFATDEPMYVNCAMAGNMSVNRLKAIDIGGFDENFVRVAYRFEDEFAQRIMREGGKIYYHPAASVIHIKASEGGTRTFGHHLTTIKPHHSVGAYYFLLRAPFVKHRVWNVMKRLITANLNKHHFKKPWWIPVTVISELSGIVWAMRLYTKGPRYINRAHRPC